MSRFNGAVAIVTGGGSGIGAATCRRLVADGARVVVADINLEAAEALAADLGADASAVRYDAADVDSVGRLVAATMDRHGRLDILHNNAAITTPDVHQFDTAAPDIPIEIWDRIMAVNVRGYLAGCKFAIPHMAAGGGGSIINTASVAGLLGDVSRIGYGTSKGAIVALTKYVATQHGAQGIRCNAVAPGLIMTAALQETAPELVDLLARHVLLGRHGQAEDIANLVAFLASDEAAFITGQVIAADGGFSAHVPHVADLLALMGGG